MYTFAQGTLADLPRFYELISARIAWMDEAGGVLHPPPGE